MPALEKKENTHIEFQLATEKITGHRKLKDYQAEERTKERKTERIKFEVETDETEKTEIRQETKSLLWETNHQIEKAVTKLTME